MSLKTAALIALIGVGVHFLLGLSNLSFYLVGVHLPFERYVYQIFWVFNLVILHGSLVLFLAVFYSKQKQ